MKFTLRLPLEQYAFAEMNIEAEDVAAAAQAYADLQSAFKVGDGIPQKDFNALLDEYLSTGTTTDGAGVWEDMSDFQRGVFQEIKKSLKRTNK